MKPQLLFGALVSLSVTFPSYAGQHICWIDRVVIEGAGVRVLFSPSGYNIAGGTHSQGRFVIGHGHITWLFGPKDRTSEPGLLLMNGESAFLIQGVEDTCEITFAEMDGHIGITAHASFSVPGVPPSNTTVFIPGEVPESKK